MVERNAFKKALWNWSVSPDDPVSIGRVSMLLKDSSEEKRELIINIKDEIFENSESSRAADIKELAKIARKQGNIWILHLMPKVERSKPKFQVMVEDLLKETKSGIKDRGILDTYNLVVKIRDESGYYHGIILRPTEIDSIIVR